MGDPNAVSQMRPPVPRKIMEGGFRRSFSMKTKRLNFAIALQQNKSSRNYINPSHIPSCYIVVYYSLDEHQVAPATGHQS
jgi:hypothetical protein